MIVAVLVAVVIAVAIREGAEGAGCVINRMHNQQVLDRQNARLTGANNCSGSSGCGSSGRTLQCGDHAECVIDRTLLTRHAIDRIRD